MRHILFYSLLILIVWVVALLSALFVPVSVPEGAKPLFVIEEGETIRTVSNNLANRGFIHSPILFTVLVRYGFDNAVYSGTYVFDTPQSLFERARQVSTYRASDSQQRLEVRIHEGANVVEIAEIVTAVFPDFDVERFLELASEKEGYLYPDTYHFNATAAPHPRIVIDRLERAFEEKTQRFRTQFELRDESERGVLKTLDDVVNLAAIVELEANSSTDRKRIAGVLLNRLERGIPLQVDVVFRAINGKNSYTLSKEDLKTDHPLNTYTRKGLPNRPIGNPSAGSIGAVLNPEESNNLYFLADRKGNTYFSETFEEHVEKKRKYIYGNGE